MKGKNPKTVIYTIGHSTHPINEFINMLKSFHIRKLIDVRTIPKSGFNPQYNQEALRKSLANEKIDYKHMMGLGGLRHANKDSINLGWRNASFRGYADYMQTEEFEDSLQELIKEAHKKTVAIMCAEAVPWRCHRSLISDSVLLNGLDVRDIMGSQKENIHKMNPMVKIDKGKVCYPET
ncbi:MAG: DUF488 domain-containing protein [Candidatus Omnitrophica bacterium]|nr:DUF488 domain-containing protein [Candidatus Omnitrophota bacterium]